MLGDVLTSANNWRVIFLKNFISVDVFSTVCIHFAGGRISKDQCFLLEDHSAEILPFRFLPFSFLLGLASSSCLGLRHPWLAVKPGWAVSTALPRSSVREDRYSFQELSYGRVVWVTTVENSFKWDLLLLFSA